MSFLLVATVYSIKGWPSFLFTLDKDKNLKINQEPIAMLKLDLSGKFIMCEVVKPDTRNKQYSSWDIALCEEKWSLGPQMKNREGRKMI